VPAKKNPLKEALRIARSQGYVVIPPTSRWIKLSIEVEHDRMESFRRVAERRPLKLKYAIDEALGDWVEKWEKKVRKDGL
jgi:hypothetical protein